MPVDGWVHGAPQLLNRGDRVREGQRISPVAEGPELDSLGTSHELPVLIASSVKKKKNVGNNSFSLQDCKE